VLPPVTNSLFPPPNRFLLCRSVVARWRSGGIIVRIGGDVTAVALRQLDDAIRKLVAGAIEDRSSIRSSTEAGRLAGEYSGAGLSTTEISELLVRAASAAGVGTQLYVTD
jgi:hypothetical protein